MLVVFALFQVYAGLAILVNLQLQVPLRLLCYSAVTAEKLSAKDLNCTEADRRAFISGTRAFAQALSGVKAQPGSTQLFWALTSVHRVFYIASVALFLRRAWQKKKAQLPPSSH
jgi:hypothetical protein